MITGVMEENPQNRDGGVTEGSAGAVQPASNRADPGDQHDGEQRPPLAEQVGGLARAGVVSAAVAGYREYVRQLSRWAAAQVPAAG